MGSLPRILIGLSVGGVATPAMAQALNLDIGPAGSPTPSESFGAAAEQTGLWNLGDAADKALSDTSGQPTACQLGLSGFLTTTTADGAAPGDRELMDSLMAGDRNGLSLVAVSNLAPGGYTAWIYAWSGPGSPNPTKSRITLVEYTTGFFQTVETDFNNIWGGQAQGVTYAKVNFNVTSTGGLLVFRLESLGQNDRSPVSVLNGIQIVPIPAPGVPAALAITALAACRRRR